MVSENTDNGLQKTEAELPFWKKLRIAYQGHGALVVATSLIFGPLVALCGLQTNTSFFAIALVLLLLFFGQLPAEKDWISGIAFLLTLIKNRR